jgi:hypothetical protein
VLPLPLLPLCDVLNPATHLIPQRIAAELSNAGVHQFVLLCGGNPRATMDGLTAAQSQILHATTTSLAVAQHLVLAECKFALRELPETHINQWFRFGGGNDEFLETLRRNSVLLEPHEGVKYLFPLAVHSWAWGHHETATLGHHLHALYDADRGVGPDAEKKMEAIMYHYEAVLRKANEGTVFSLQAFYQTEHVGKNFSDVRVTAPVPERVTLVEELDDFSDVDRVLHALDQGFIVVSKAHSELGIEYMAPFRDAETKELIVACVQCKFVNSKTEWADIRTKLETAMKPLKDRKRRCFPVVYTTADQRRFNSGTLDGVDGLYFIEKDIFRFTNKLGILRLHTQKLGRALAKDYPFLNAAVIPQAEEAGDMVTGVDGAAADANSK